MLDFFKLGLYCDFVFAISPRCVFSYLLIKNNTQNKILRTVYSDTCCGSFT